MFYRHKQMQVMVFELSETTLRVERHRIAVDCMHHHDFEADVPGSHRDLAERMKQKP